MGNERIDGITDTVDYYRIDSDQDQAVNLTIGLETAFSDGSSFLVEIVDIEENVLLS